MHLSIITVTWNSSEHIARQIASVQQAAKHIEFEHFVVDNNSSDATAQIIERQFPQVKLIENIHNAGFGAAHNQVIGEVKGKYLLFLNPDMELAPQSLDQLLVWAESQADFGIAGCKLVSPEGKMRDLHRPVKFPTLTQLILIIFKLAAVFPALAKSWNYSDEELTKDAQVDTVRGSFMLVKRELVERLGFAFDPRYFIWFEDVDLCQEAKRLNYKVLFTPIITCIDFAGQSFKKINQVRRQKQFLQSAVIYFKKWHPRYQSFILQVLSPIGIGLVWLYAKVQNIFSLSAKDAIHR